MALSYQTEVSDGVRTLYSITFEYLSKADVFVYTGSHDDYQTQISYRWADNQTIELTDLTQVPSQTSFNIRRVQDRTKLLHEFVNKSIRPYTLDDQNRQALFIVQELTDGFTGFGELTDIVSSLDMNQFGIDNMQDGSTDASATTVSQVRGMFSATESTTIAAKDEAVAARQAAGLSETAAANSASQSAVSSEKWNDRTPDKGLRPTNPGDPDGSGWEVGAGDGLEATADEVAIDMTNVPMQATLSDDFEVIIQTPQGLRKTTVGAMTSAGGGVLEFRGTITLDDSGSGTLLTTATIHDSLDAADYAVDLNVNPRPGAKAGDAYAVDAAARNGITDDDVNWVKGHIIYWADSLGWVPLAAGVQKWQGKEGDVVVALGDLSSDVLHLGADTTMSLTQAIAEAGFKTPTLHLTNFGAVDKGIHFVDASAASVTVTLPDNPREGFTCIIGDVGDTLDATHLIILDPQTKLIEGVNDTHSLETPRSRVRLTFTGVSYGWLLQSAVGI